MEYARSAIVMQFAGAICDGHELKFRIVELFYARALSETDMLAISRPPVKWTLDEIVRVIRHG